jgi:hypothetical protein
MRLTAIDRPLRRLWCGTPQTFFQDRNVLNSLRSGIALVDDSSSCFIRIKAWLLKAFEPSPSPCQTTTFVTPLWLANSTFLLLTPM